VGTVTTKLNEYIFKDYYMLENQLHVIEQSVPVKLGVQTHVNELSVISAKQYPPLRHGFEEQPEAKYVFALSLIIKFLLLIIP